MPTFVLLVSVNLHELLEDGICAPNTFGSKSCGIMEVTVYKVIMLVRDTCLFNATRICYSQT
jgi:hypothetical protein